MIPTVFSARFWQQKENNKISERHNMKKKNLLVLLAVFVTIVAGHINFGVIFKYEQYQYHHIKDHQSLILEDTLKHDHNRNEANYTSYASEVMDSVSLQQHKKHCVYSILGHQNYSSERNLPLQLQEFATLFQVYAYNIDDVKSMLENGSLVLNGIEDKHLVNTIACTRKHNKIQNRGANYSLLQEIAVTLSHLNAILQAYNNKDCTSALILEDNAKWTDNFHLNHWRKYAAEAPSDWKVLQWATSNNAIHDRAFYLSNDYWLAWKPYHWSTVAYEIQRDGMKLILDKSYKKHRNSSVDRWIFDDGLFLSDELIYYHATPTYTSSFPWFLTNTTRNAVENGKKLNIDEPIIRQQDGIAIIMNCRWKDKQEVVREVHHLAADILEMAKFNPNSFWFLKVVLTNHKLLPTFNQISKKIPSQYSEVQVQVNNHQFNKFVFIHQLLKKLAPFEYILLKDNDIRISGFPWNTFMNMMNDSIIAAPFYETHEQLLCRSQSMKKILGNFQNAAVFNKFDDISFMRKFAIQTMAIEQGFALMRANFSIWYFSSVLTDKFLGQVTDWGPDMMWCGAAHTYHIKWMGNPPSISACSLIPINILHSDTKQLQTNKIYSSAGRKAIHWFKDNSTFERWISARPRAFNNFQQLKMCQKVDKSYSECAIEIANVSVSKMIHSNEKQI